MADTENEKAEKLAAARKRFEELKRKKQPNKKASNSGAHQKEPTSSSSPPLETQHHEATTVIEGSANDMGQQDPMDTDPTGPTEHGEKLVEDKSPEQPDSSSTNNGPLVSRSATSEVLLETLPEIYRKQASVIDELRAEKQQLLDEIKGLQSRAQEGSKAMVERDRALEDLAAVSEELQIVKERNGVEQATLLAGAGEASTLKIEVASLNRQIAHLQSQISQKDKTIIDIRRDSTLSSPGPEGVTKQEDRIENMSVELSESRAALETSVLLANNLKLERDSLKTLVDSMKVELETTTRNTKDLSNKLNGLTQSISSDSAKNSVWEEKSSRQEETINELNRKLGEMTLTIDHLKQQNQELQASEGSMETRYRDIERKLANAQRENSSMQLRLAQLKSSLHESSTKAGPLTNAETNILSKEGDGNGDAKDMCRFQEGTGSSKSSSADHLWRQVLADENSQDFLEVDLRAVTKNTAQTQSILEPPLERDDKRRFLTHRVRKELESWKGHRINLIDVYSAYDDSYSRVFDV
ncbi:hypothetical protein TWF718_008929 [Orbilia javanica]|uniref:Uncharacterized protein n=1 Tax=Orbilia javanica TaxID=47235 RepID=A0AAN8MU30_9PEZI